MEPTVQSAPQRMAGRTKAGLWLLIAPTVLIIATFVLFAVINLILNSTLWPVPDGESPTPTPIGITLANVSLFIIGSMGVIAWLPALIVGIVLLATAKK